MEAMGIKRVLFNNMHVQIKEASRSKIPASNPAPGDIVSTTTIYIFHLQNGRHVEISCGHKHRSTRAWIKCKREKERMIKKYGFRDSSIVVKYNN